jgi:hypothetical protein
MRELREKMQRVKEEIFATWPARRAIEMRCNDQE